MRLEKAMTMAIATHMGEVDKLGEPYILHPVRVMQAFDDEPSRIVGILHDVIKTNRRIKFIDIEDVSFGGHVIAEALDSITRREEETYEDYINRCKGNPLARRVKIADLFDNLSPARIKALDYQTYMRLSTKYKRALAVLL
jgi:(p)ppGpp synthase/HD superfamily hydrolase